MGLIANVAQGIVSLFTPVPSIFSLPRSGIGLGGGSPSYTTFARQGYQGNEIVFAAIELLATSAAEPKIIGQRHRRNSPHVAAAIKAAHSDINLYGLPPDEKEHLAARAFISTTRRHIATAGIPHRYVTNTLIRNGFIEPVMTHPLVRLLNNPNPFMSRFEFFSTLIMYRYLAGNAYILKVRNPRLGNVVELWLLRPDRVRIIPSATEYIEAYEYSVGSETIRFPRNDVIHWKTRNPFDTYYGMPPLMSIASRIDIDNYMRNFLKLFFERGGTGPAAVLTVKSKLSDMAKTEIRDRLRSLFGGSSGIHETLILDNTESSYTQLGLDRGLRDALPKDLNALNESRIALAFGIPGSILGLLIGYESSSYANKRQDWQVLWDITLAPMYSDLDDQLNLSLTPEFDGIDEVLCDLTDVRALQEDEDALQERARKNFQVGLWSFEESRAATGVDPEPKDGTFYIPVNIRPTPLDILTTESEQAAADPGVGATPNGGVPKAPPGRKPGPQEPDHTPAPEPAPTPEPEPAPAPKALSMVEIVSQAQLRKPVRYAADVKSAVTSAATTRRGPGRPRTREDPVARGIYENARMLLLENPTMTIAQVAAKLNIDARTYYRYRDAFQEQPALS